MTDTIKIPSAIAAAYAARHPVDSYSSPEALALHEAIGAALAIPAVMGSTGQYIKVDLDQPRRFAPAYPDPELARVCAFVGADGAQVVLLDGVDQTRDLGKFSLRFRPGMPAEVDAEFVYAPPKADR
jgi:hypothetical protein